MSDSDPAAAIAALAQSLPDLEAAFEPILSQPWNELVDKLEPLDRAKLDVFMAYAINNLIWVYLKTRGIDPADHEVSAELERIKTYYIKIQAAEQPKEQRKTKVDVPAAARFISAAIPNSQRRPQAGDGDVAEDGPSTSAQALARHQARAAVEEREAIERMGMDRRFRFVAEQTEYYSSEGSEEDVQDDDGDGNEGDTDEDGNGNVESAGEGKLKSRKGVAKQKDEPQHIVFDDDAEPGAEHKAESHSKGKRKRAEDFS